MKECKTPGCKNTELVYSGVDAMVFGLPMTETYCYSCAAAYMTIKADVADAQQNAGVN